MLLIFYTIISYLYICINNYGKAPYILLIDLDGTIQGDITPQLKEYVLQKSLGIKSNKNF